MNSTAVITISSRVPTEPYYFLNQFMASCKRQNVWPIFINGEKWCGLMSKPIAMLDWIHRNGQYYEHIIFCDAWDILWLGTVEEVLEKYAAFKSPLVFNAERNCFPRADLEPQYNPAPTPYRFLNSGFIVGTPAAFIDCLQEMKLDRIGVDYQKPDGSWVGINDQEHFAVYYLANQLKAQLDYKGTICQTLHGAADDEFELQLTGSPGEPRVFSRLTGSMPTVVHGNGAGKDWLKKIMGWLKL